MIAALSRIASGRNQDPIYGGSAPMRTTCTLIIACGLALCACDKSSNSSSNSSNGSSASGAQNAAASSTPVKTGATTGQEAPDRGTSRGTVDLFVAAMADGDYETVLSMVDPTCEGFGELANMQEGVSIAEGKNEEFALMLKALYTQAWPGATVSELVQQEGLVRYQVSFENADPLVLDLRDATGEWLIICGPEVFVRERPKTPTPPADPPADPPAGG